jgi:hypothetical protein
VSQSNAKEIKCKPTSRVVPAQATGVTVTLSPSFLDVMQRVAGTQPLQSIDFIFMNLIEIYFGHKASVYLNGALSPPHIFIH